MYPDLSYLFHDLIGTQPDNWLAIFKMFGFMLALAFLASAFFYFLELKRKADEGIFGYTTEKIIEGLPAQWPEMLSSAVVGAIIGGKFLYARAHFAEFRVDPASIILSRKMDWLGAAIGLAVGLFLTWWEAHRNRKPEPVEKIVRVYPHHRIAELTVWAAVSGIFGAKLFDIFDNWESFLRDPIGSFTSGGGLAIYGGLICGFIGVASYVVYKKIPLLHAMDACAPALIMGMAVGRVGCQLSGDGDWGIANTAPKPGWMSFLPDWLWGYRYPNNVLNEGVPIPGCSFEYCSQLAEPVFPTPFYETCLFLIIFGILWAFRKKWPWPGFMFGAFMILNGIERFFIEKIRVNVQHEWLGFQGSQAQFIAIGMIVGGLILAAWSIRRFQKTSVTP